MLLAIIVLVLSLGAVFRSWFQSGEPVWVATPTMAPACSRGSGSDISGGGLVTVDSNPSYACPMDDATRVDLYLAYPGHTQSQLVVISLTGCRGICAPNRDTRTYPDQLNRDLAPVAPAAWASYVTI